MEHNYQNFLFNDLLHIDINHPSIVQLKMSAWFINGSNAANYFISIKKKNNSVNKNFDQNNYSKLKEM